MTDPGFPPLLSPQRNDRMVALFLLGCLLFNPPLLRVFGADATVLGWPILYVYIFSVWILFIAMIAGQVERRRRDSDDFSE